MSLNLFYFSPTNRKTASIELKINDNINDLFENISSIESIPANNFKLYSNGKLLESTNHLRNDSIICLHFGLNGGKGGFGSMLRAIGAQIEKTTNREACRDLTGRRLRDINEEKRIKEWIKKEKLRKEEMEERRRQKLSKLTQKPKTEFNDLEFERNREEIPEIVDEALQYGLKLKEEQTAGSSKRKSEEDSALKKKKLKKSTLWIGDDIDIEDDSDDCEEQTINSYNTEDQSTKDSNESEVIIDSNIIDNQSNESLLENKESIVQQIDSKEESDSVSGISTKSEEVIDMVTTHTKHKESDKNKELVSDSSKDREQVFEALNLMDFKSFEQLEALGLDRLKHALMTIGLKCGGSLSERANRLWSIRGLDIKDIPKKLFAKKK